MAKFIWGLKSDKKKYHYASLKNLSYPTDEEGVGMRNLKDVCLSFQYKQWKVFSTKHI